MRDLSRRPAPRSTKRCTLRPPEASGSRFCNPVWLTQNTLLAHTQLGDGFFDLPYTLDVRTGRSTVQPEVRSYIHSFRGSRWQFSSDKKWFLYAQGGFGRYSILAVASDGRRAQTWKLPEPLEVIEYFWMPGTHEWIELWGGKDSPNRPTIARLRRLGSPLPIWQRKLPDLGGNGAEFIGYSANREAVLTLNSPDGTIQLAFLSIPDMSLARHKTIQVGNGETSDWMLAPDKKRLVFSQGSNHWEPNSLWVVGLDGSGLQRLAKVSENESLVPIGFQPGTGLFTYFHARGITQYQEGHLYQVRLS